MPPESGPARSALADWVLASGSRYWTRGVGEIRNYAMPMVAGPRENCSQVEAVQLPEWAADLGVGPDGHILVSTCAITEGPDPTYARVDWVLAAALHLMGEAELEATGKGVSHSYAVRVPGLDARLFDHAWFHRIALFLRRTVARHLNMAEHDLFGPLPEAEVDLTHDVDALRLTLPIRFKQSAFNLFNVGRALGIAWRR